MKNILLSIRPEWVAKILNRDKTIEIRKTMPKCELPCKVYIYETKGKFTKGLYNNLDHKIHYYEYFGKCKIVAEFTLNTVECFTTDYRKNAEQTARICKRSCVDIDDLIDYEYGSPCLYAWHIDDLKIYDEPRELSEFQHWVVDNCGWNNKNSKKENLFVLEPLKRPPQSWYYIEENSDAKD